MKNVYEVFNEFSKATTKHEKIDVLRRNNSWALRSVLQGMFDPRTVFVIKELPPYTPSDSPPGMGYSSLASEMGRCYLFEEGNPRVDPNLTLKRKMEILTQMLEVLEAREAEVFGDMLLKKCRVKGLTAALAKEAFPDIF